MVYQINLDLAVIPLLHPTDISCLCPSPNFPLFPFSLLPYILLCLIFYVNMASFSAFPLPHLFRIVIIYLFPFLWAMPDEALMALYLILYNQLTMFFTCLLSWRLISALYFLFLFCENKHYFKKTIGVLGPRVTNCNKGMYPLESSRICTFKDLSVLHKMNMCLSVCSVSQMRPQQYYYFQEVRQQWGQWKVTYSLIRYTTDRWNRN
jgi:hypothetical protein